MQISTQPGSGSSGTGQQGDTEPSSAIEFLYFDIEKVPKAKIRPIAFYCIYCNIFSITLSKTDNFLQLYEIWMGCFKNIVNSSQPQCQN